MLLVPDLMHVYMNLTLCAPLRYRSDGTKKDPIKISSMVSAFFPHTFLVEVNFMCLTSAMFFILSPYNLM